MPDLEIRLSGSGGQGILLAGRILADALGLEALNVAQSQSYEPTSRGGLSRADLVASDTEVDYPLASNLDYLVILDQIAVNASTDLLAGDSLILVDEPLAEICRLNGHKPRFLPISQSARELGDIRSTNMVAVGALVSISGLCHEQSLMAAVKRVAPAKLVNAITQAVERGYSIAQEAS